MNWRTYYKKADDDPMRVICVKCDKKMHVGAGRPQRHLREHNIDGDPAHKKKMPEGKPLSEVLTPKGAEMVEKSSQENTDAPFKIGTKEWAMWHLEQTIEGNPSPNEKSAAIRELSDLKKWKDRPEVDLEAEREKHLDVWTRAIHRAGELEKREKRILRDPTMRAYYSSLIAEFEV